MESYILLARMYDMHLLSATWFMLVQVEVADCHLMVRWLAWSPAFEVSFVLHMIAACTPSWPSRPLVAHRILRDCDSGNEMPFSGI